jgi:hypothetical protein
MLTSLLQLLPVVRLAAGRSVPAHMKVTLSKFYINWKIVLFFIMKSSEMEVIMRRTWLENKETREDKKQLKKE